jgi:nucleotide-binding universal stress UspA family protein
MQNIVVGTEESDGAATALLWAADEADRHGATLTAVLAWGYLDQHRATPSDDFDTAYDDADAGAALDAILERVLGPERAAGVKRRVINDLAPQAMVDAAADADLLVVGARGLGQLRGAVLGSVSRYCLQHAPCPVAVIRQTAPPTENHPRIVVGIDGSSSALQALAWALDEGRAHQAKVEVVNVWHQPYLGAYPFDPGVVDIGAFEEAARDLVEDALRQQDVRDLPVPPEAVIVEGGAATAILTTAQGADLVVLGSRGRGGFAELLLGSVSHQVAHHASCPVVVVRPES